MKKLLLIFPLLFSFQLAEAQYRFYAGVKGGPNVSFSNCTIEPRSWDKTPNAKIRHLKGLVAGYHFAKQKFSIEAGFEEQFHASVINFNQHWHYPTPHQITIRHHGTATSLRLKAVLNNPEARVKIRTILGGSSYTPYPYLDHNKNPWRDNIEKYYYVFPYSPDRPENFAFATDGGSMVGNFKNIWLFRTGMEVEMEVFNHVSISLGVEYQNGTRPVSLVNFEYTYDYQRQPGQSTGTINDPLYPGSVISRAEAINLNLSLTYSFSKRKKKMDKTDI